MTDDNQTGTEPPVVLTDLAARAATMTPAEVDAALTAMLPELARLPDEAAVDCQIRGIGQAARGLGVAAGAALKALAKMRKAARKVAAVGADDGERDPDGIYVEGGMDAGVGVPRGRGWGGAADVPAAGAPCAR